MEQGDPPPPAPTGITPDPTNRRGESYLKIPVPDKPPTIPDDVIDYISVVLRPLLSDSLYRITEAKQVGSGFVAVAYLTNEARLDGNSFDRIYIWKKDDVIQHFTSVESFIRFIASEQTWLERLLQFRIVSGLVALILLSTIAYAVVMDRIGVIQALGSALSLILGVYIGREGRK